MKVMFATYPVAFHTPGGGEIQLLAYERYLPSLGVEVVRFNPWEPNFYDCDLVHFFSCVGGSVHFCNFVKQLGIPLVVSSSLWITEETLANYPAAEINAQLGLADRIVTNSDIESDTLSRILGLNRARFSTVYNGIDEYFFKREDPSLFRNHENIQARFILNVGNVEPRKNQLTLVRAMKSFPNFKLVLIGHSRDPAYTEVCINEGGGQVIYLGPYQHDSELLRSAYSACELFCLPSTLETPGLAALEAMAVGCPLCITQVGATREYFGGFAEYLDPADVSSIVSALQATLRHNHESRAAALACAQNFLWGEVVKRLVAVYQDALRQ